MIDNASYHKSKSTTRYYNILSKKKSELAAFAKDVLKLDKIECDVEENNQTVKRTYTSDTFALNAPKGPKLDQLFNPLNCFGHTLRE